MKNQEISKPADAYTDGNLFSGVRGTAIKILNRVDRTDVFLEKIIESELKNSELKGADKALLFEIVHGTVRWLNRLDWILTGFYKGQYVKCIPNVKNAMRVALYQILFLDKVPYYAAVNESVEFVKRLQGKKSADLTNAVLRNIIRNKDGIRFPDREEDLVGFFSAYYSHPIWLVKRWMIQFGEIFTEELMKANNQRPNITLRVNKLKSSYDEVAGLLTRAKVKFEKSKYFDDFIVLKSLTNIAEWEFFKRGYVTIQDESTAFACNLLEVEENMKVLDMCAAPGGKSAFLADKMNNKGEIVSLDKYDIRLKIMKKNLDRLGIKNVRLVECDALNFEEKDFDKILLDAPCSGLGTLRKKPDIKWKRGLSDIRKLVELQKALLNKAAELVRVGGEIVYSTCTIEREENFDVIENFLENHKNFELVNANKLYDENILDGNGCFQSYPHIHDIDGAFAAKLKRIK